MVGIECHHFEVLVFGIVNLVVASHLKIERQKTNPDEDAHKREEKPFATHQQPDDDEDNVEQDEVEVSIAEQREADAFGRGNHACHGGSKHDNQNQEVQYQQYGFKYLFQLGFGFG